jgi:hypothetical protein
MRHARRFALRATAAAAGGLLLVGALIAGTGASAEQA